MRVHLVWAATIMVVAITTTAGFLAWHGADTSIIGTIISLVSSIITVVLYGQVAEVKQQVAAVKEQTNGNTTASAETIRAQLEAHNQLLRTILQRQETGN